MAPPSGLGWSLLTSSHPALPVTPISPDHLGGDVQWEWPTPHRPSSQFQVCPLALPQLHLIMRKTRRRRDQWYETSQIIFFLVGVLRLLSVFVFLYNYVNVEIKLYVLIGLGFFLHSIISHHLYLMKKSSANQNTNTCKHLRI